MSYTIETAISTHVLKHVYVPKFKPKNALHTRLSKLSKRAHELAKRGKSRELKKVEEKIDKMVAQLYGITDTQLKEIRKTLQILKGAA